MRSQTVVLISVRRLLSNASFSCGSDPSICGDLSAERADAHKPGCPDGCKDPTRQGLCSGTSADSETLNQAVGINVALKL